MGTRKGGQQAAQPSAGFAAQQELRPPGGGNIGNSGLRGGDRRYATPGGRGAITLVECCGGKSRAWDKTVRVEVMTSGNSQFKNRALVSTTDHTDFTDTGLCKIHYLSVKSVVKKRDNAR